MMNFDIYRSLDLEVASFLPRSYLYQLPPIGVDTPWVESLTGYIARLAEAHCVHPGILTEQIIAPIINKKYSSANLHKIYSHTSTLNGTGIMANDLILALEKLTEQNNLSNLTLTKWTKILPSRNLLHQYRTWCPLCYDHWNREQDPIYEPLIWTLELVKVCPIHYIPLQQKCPNCHQNNLLLSWKSRPGYCFRCEKWLGNSQLNLINHSLPNSDLEWDSWVVDNIKAFFAANLDPSSLNISESLTKIVEKFTDGNIAALSRRLKMPKNTVWLWCKGKNQPSFEALLTICYRLKLNLVNFLKNTDSYSERFGNYPKSSPITSTSRKTPTFNPVHARQELTKILNDTENLPLSLEEVAKQISYDRRTLHRHFPELCRQISARYLSYRKTCHHKAVKQCCLEIKQAVTMLYQQGIYPTEDRISKLISQPGYLRYKIVREAFNEAREQTQLLSDPLSEDASLYHKSP